MLALPQETRLIFFTIANNICTLLMPVYKYGIAMFYIYLYMSISISIYINIYSHTLKRNKEKDQRFPGNRFCWRAPEPSEEGRQRTALPLDSHTRCPPQAGRRGTWREQRRSVSRGLLRPRYTWFCNHDSWHGGSPPALELSMVALFGDQCSWGSCVPLMLLDFASGLQAPHSSETAPSLLV